MLNPLVHLHLQNFQSEILSQRVIEWEITALLFTLDNKSSWQILSNASDKFCELPWQGISIKSFENTVGF